jgi:uncharacterized protein DUF5916/cellulose/xylan binding protein with CBM9 domain
MPLSRSVVANAVFVVLTSPLLLAAQHTITAIRSHEKIIVDGVLNDKAWETAIPATEFTQRDPEEGKPATERTELRVAYDDSSIYFGVRLWDSEPRKIVRQLSRRDNYSDADTFTIQISPYHDRLTGAIFEISAAGVQRDAIVSNDVFTDYSWEGVWESSVQVDEQGWCAEIRIPFSQLRFPSAEHQVWGINAARFIHRKNESVWLRMVPKTENGLASRMDDLDGIDGVEARRHLDLMPYIVGRSEFIEPASRDNPFNDGSRHFQATGLDIKYGLSSDFTLDATVNPDFGQVEVDPAVVNLTAFETFFPEKRPFFLEGANIFNNFGRGGSNNFWGFNRQEPNLFYSRRIGRPPQGTTSGDFVDTPVATTILGAGKLTGKTRNGWTFGLVEAVTGREYAGIMKDGRRSNLQVEPLTNYFVGRVLKEKDRGGFGFLTTGAQRDLSVPELRDQLPARAFVAGGDGYFYLDSDKEWVVTGRLAGSWMKGNAAAIDKLEHSSQHYFQRPDAGHVRLHPGATSMEGWTGSVNLNRQRGNVTFNASLWGTSPGFESNDLGFQTGGDIAGTHAVVLYRKPNPDRWTRSRYAWTGKWMTWNYARQIQGNGWIGEAGFTTMSYWSFGFNAGLNWRVQDDRLTRGGPAAIGMGGRSINVWGSSDSRKKISLNYYYGQGSNNAGGWNKQGNVAFNLKPTSSFTISTGPSVNRSRGRAQYVKSVTDATGTNTYGGRYVFADIDQFQVSMTTRVNWTLNPKISLQVFTQPLISVGDYWDFKEFARPNTFSFTRYGYDIGRISANEKREYTVDPDGDGPAPPFTFDDPDFNLKSLRINAIFRWEWKLGSTLYFVWTQNREDKSNPGQFSARRDVGKLFTAPSNDIFLVRLAYWFTR